MASRIGESPVLGRQPRTILKQMGLLDAGQPAVHLAPDLTHALERARAIVEAGASAGTSD